MSFAEAAHSAEFLNLQRVFQEIEPSLQHTCDVNLNGLAFDSLPFPAWVVPINKHSPIANPAYHTKFSAKNESVCNKLTASDRRVLETERSLEVMEELLTVDSKNRVRVRIIKFPVYNALELIGVGSIVLY